MSNVLITPHSPEGKERLKWEYEEFSLNGVRGQRGPRTFEEFPKMMSLAGRSDTGKIVITREQVAGDADEQARLESEGFRCGHDKAIEAHERREQSIAELAANRAFQERTMSDAARREAAEYEESEYGHVAEIPEAPKKRGRPRKDNTE